MGEKMYKILIVDDEDEIRTAIVNTVDFEAIGFSLVGEACNGVEALEMTERLSPDLIVTDIKMPFMSGIELARSVREIHPNTFIAFLTGYEDFSYAKAAIKHNIVSYLLKPISAQDFTKELTEIKKNMDNRKEQLINPPILPEVEQLRHFEIVNIIMPMLYYAQPDVVIDWCVKRLQGKGLKLSKDSDIAVLRIEFPEDKPSVGLERKQFLMQIVDKYVSNYSFAISNTGIVMFYGNRKQLEKFVKIIAMELIETSDKTLNMEVVVGVSGIYKFTNLTKAYSESISATEYAKSLGSDMIFIHDIERSDSDFIDKFANLGNELENALKYTMYSDFEDYLIKIEGDLLSKNVSLLKYYNYAVYVIYRAISSLTGEFPDEIKEVLEQIMTMDAVTQFKTEFKPALCKVKIYLDNMKRDSSTKLCDDAIAIIDKTYCDPDLSLNSLSSALSCSSPYLSMLIKKTTGCSFVNILTKKRMDMAETLIRSTDLKIACIAEKTGYLDQHYFSYCFKKYFGKSPLKVRQEK